MVSKKTKTGGYKLTVPKRANPGARPPGYFGGGSLTLVSDTETESESSDRNGAEQLAATLDSKQNEARLQGPAERVGEGAHHVPSEGVSSSNATRSRDMIHKRFPVERHEGNELRDWVNLFRDSKGGSIPEAVVYRAAMALARASTPEILARLSESAFPPRPSTKDTLALARWEKAFIEIFLGPKRMAG